VRPSLARLAVERQESNRSQVERSIVRRLNLSTWPPRLSPGPRSSALRKAWPSAARRSINTVALWTRAVAREGETKDEEALSERVVGRLTGGAGRFALAETELSALGWHDVRDESEWMSTFVGRHTQLAVSKDTRQRVEEEEIQVGRV